jgi:hypothetical protein
MCYPQAVECLREAKGGMGTLAILVAPWPKFPTLGVAGALNLHGLVIGDTVLYLVYLAATLAQKQA